MFSEQPHLTILHFEWDPHSHLSKNKIRRDCENMKPTQDVE